MSCGFIRAGLYWRFLRKLGKLSFVGFLYIGPIRVNTNGCRNLIKGCYQIHHWLESFQADRHTQHVFYVMLCCLFENVVYGLLLGAQHIEMTLRIDQHGQRNPGNALYMVWVGRSAANAPAR